MMASFVTKCFIYFAKLGAICTIVFKPCRAFETTNNASFWLPLLSINMTCTNTGNNITGGHIPCTYTPQYAMSTAGSSDNFRNIISYNSNGYASLGFEQVRTGAFCLSIYWFYPSKCLLQPNLLDFIRHLRRTMMRITYAISRVRSFYEKGT